MPPNSYTLLLGCMATTKYKAQERYEKKNGITVKSFKVKKELANQFTATCQMSGESQTTVISRLMQSYIDEHSNQQWSRAIRRTAYPYRLSSTE